MPANRTAAITDHLDALSSAALPITFAAFSDIAVRIAAHFRVDADEVAILRLNPDAKLLYFLLPEPLRQVGQIPLSSTSSLAARTVREKRPERINNFTNTRHSSVFEGVPLASGPGVAIQKIISAPVASGKEILAVIQVSHKGDAPESAGDDFTAEDLADLSAIAAKLAPCIKLLVEA